MDLPWDEEYMLRQSYPMYDAFCREDEEDNYDKEAADEALADLRRED